MSSARRTKSEREGYDEYLESRAPRPNPDLLEAERIAGEGIALSFASGGNGDSNADKVARAYLYLLARCRTAAELELWQSLVEPCEVCEGTGGEEGIGWCGACDGTGRSEASP